MSRTNSSSKSIRGGKDSKRGCLQNSLYFATLAVCTVGFLITTYGTMSKYFSDSKLTSMYYQVLWPHLNLKTKLILYLLNFSPTKSYPYPTLSFATGQATKVIPPTKYFQGKATWRAQWIHNWFCWILTYLEKEVRPMSMSRSTKQISEQSTLTSAGDACAFHTDLGFVLW